MNGEDLRRVTIDTYNKSANDFVEYFAGIGSRETDIGRVVELTVPDYTLAENWYSVHGHTEWFELALWRV